MNNKEIKMNYKKETKRCIMPKTYTEFKQMISKCYLISEKEINNLLISYTDDEEDKVLITSDFDFDQAIIFMEKQKLNILRINIDIPDVNDNNFEMIEKSLKQTDLNNSLDKSFKSNILKEEVKESPKDINNLTISSIARDTERNVNKMNEICNKIEKMNIIDKIENFSTFETKNTNEKTEKSVGNNIENVLNKININEIKEEVIPINKEDIKKEKNERKRSKKEKKFEIMPIFKEVKEEDEIIEKFGQKLKKNLNKFLDNKLNKLKEKICEKTMKKSVKIMEKFMKKKKSSPRNLEDIIPQKNSNLVIHSGVTCDDCGISPIKGNRYKCAVCHNFDLCSACEEKNKDTHKHPFILIRSPERAPYSISCVVNENCPIIQKNIPFNQDYKLADVILNNSIIGETSELSSQCLTSNLTIVSSENSKEIVKTLKIKNNGLKSWPKPVYLTCISESSTLIGNSVPIKLKVDSGKESNVEIKLNNKDMKSGEYVTVWQLQNEKKEFFGEQFVIFIKLENSSKQLERKSPFDNEPKENFKPKSEEKRIINDNSKNIIEESYKPKEEIFDSFVYECQVEELKNVYNLKCYNDKTIKKAAIDAKGDIDKTLQILMQCGNEKK